MRKQTVNILLRLSLEDAAYLDRLVKKSGRTRTSYLREIIRGNQLCEKPDAAFYQSMKELARFGSNLNQLTAKAHTLGFIDTPALRKEIAEWQDFRKAIFEDYLEPRKGK